jgi:hypothetical protein
MMPSLSPQAFLRAAGIVGIATWAGYVRLMIVDDYPPHMGADAMLMAGLICFAVAAAIKPKGDDA